MPDMFNRVGSFRSGYSIADVDDFMSRARTAYEGATDDVDARDVFDIVFGEQRGGYQRSAVDATLDRLAAAFIQRDRAEYSARHGQQAWLDHVADRATALYPRLTRPAGERFAHPQRGQIGYSASQVDELMERIVAFFNEGQELTAQQVRTVVFSAKRGDKAYSEPVVDAYLNRLLEVLLSVE